MTTKETTGKQTITQEGSKKRRRGEVKNVAKRALLSRYHVKEG